MRLLKVLLPAYKEGRGQALFHIQMLFDWEYARQDAKICKGVLTVDEEAVY